MYTKLLYTPGSKAILPLSLMSPSLKVLFRCRQVPNQKILSLWEDFLDYHDLGSSRLVGPPSGDCAVNPSRIEFGTPTRAGVAYLSMFENKPNFDDYVTLESPTSICIMLACKCLLIGRGAY